MSRPILLISLQEDLDVIGLRSLHYHLLAHAYDSQLLFLPRCHVDAAPDKVRRTICRFVEQISPMFIGVSLMSLEHRRAAHLTRLLKAHCPGTPVIWGGIHPTIAPETCLDDADFVCIGEGETTIRELAETLRRGDDPRGLRNLCFRQDGQIVRNPLHPLISDLDNLSLCQHVPRQSFLLRRGTIAPLSIPDFRKFARYGGTMCSVPSSRGCPFACTYCCNNALAAIYATRRVRFRSLAHVMAELKQAVTESPFIEYINFQDDCFLARSDADIEQFAQAYARQIGRPFVIRSIPTFVTRRKIAPLQKAGLAWISLGLQSGSDRVCDEVYRRRSTPQQFLDAAQIIQERALAAYYDVILDNPFETEQERLQTAATLAQTPRPFYTQFFSLSLFPGTELRERAMREGLIRGDEYQTKVCYSYQNTTINKLVRLAAFLPPAWTKRLLGAYACNPDSWWFKARIVMARLANVVWFEPLTSLKVIWLSQAKKPLATARVLPHYAKEGLSRFRRQFR